jgi:hypothetical protein
MIMHALYDATSLGLAAWEVHTHGAEGTAPLFNAASAARLAIGLAMAAGGAWMLFKARPAVAPPSDDVGVSRRAFEVVRASEPA